MDEGIFSDPEKIRLYAETLRSVLHNHRHLLEQLDSRLSGLGNSWLDQQYHEFRSEVKKTQMKLSEFIEEGERTVLLLIKRAEDLEKYTDITI